MAQQADETAAHELALWATTSSNELYQRSVKPVALNLARKIVAGTYDAALALKAWGYTADLAAELYLKEHTAQIAAGDWDHSIFTAVTRRAAAVEIAAAYDELVQDYAADLKAEKANRKRWTIGAIRDANAAAGFYFFDRDTLRFWGDKVSNWAPRYDGPRVFIERVKSPSKDAALFPPGARHEFNPETGDIGVRLDDAT